MTTAVLDRSSSRKPRRWLKGLALTAGVLLILWMCAVLSAVSTLTSRKRSPYSEPVPTITGADLVERRVTTSDGHQLGAWFVRGPGKPAVLLMHGNGADRTSRLDELQFLVDRGCSVLTLTMRAHGDSSGEVNDFGYSARSDVIAAVRELKSLCPQQPICVWGGSLSAAAAIFAAPELESEVDHWLLECPYADLETAVRQRLDRFLPPVLVPVAEWNLHRGADVILPHWRKISPLEAARRFPQRGSVTIVTGKLDTRATPTESQLIATAMGPHARVVIVDNADHMQTFAVDRKTYEDWINPASSLRYPAATSSTTQHR